MYIKRLVVNSWDEPLLLGIVRRFRVFIQNFNNWKIYVYAVTIVRTALADLRSTRTTLEQIHTMEHNKQSVISTVNKQIVTKFIGPNNIRYKISPRSSNIHNGNLSALLHIIYISGITNKLQTTSKFHSLRTILQSTPASRTPRKILAP